MTTEIGFEVTPHRVHVRLRGDLDLETVPTVDAELDAAERLGRTLIVLDLRGVTLLSMAALHRLLAAETGIAERGGRLVVVCGPPVRRVLHLAGLVGRLATSGSPPGARVGLDDRPAGPLRRSWALIASPEPHHPLAS